MRPCVDALWHVATMQGHGESALQSSQRSTRAWRQPVWAARALPGWRYQDARLLAQ
jgi:hypothetical protein